MAIECDIQVSNGLGHQIAWLRDLLPRTQQYPYTQSWCQHIQRVHSPESTFLSLKIAQAFSQLKLLRGSLVMLHYDSSMFISGGHRRLRTVGSFRMATNFPPSHLVFFGLICLCSLVNSVSINCLLLNMFPIPGSLGILPLRFTFLGSVIPTPHRRLGASDHGTRHRFDFVRRSRPTVLTISSQSSL